MITVILLKEPPITPLSKIDPAYPLRLTGNTFLNNMLWAVYAKPDNSWSDVLLTGNNSSGSSWNGFGLEGTITGTVTFSTTAGFPFMAEQEVAVAAGSTLTVTPGTTFKFSGKALTVNGRLLARGVAADPVVCFFPGRRPRRQRQQQRYPAGSRGQVHPGHRRVRQRAGAHLDRLRSGPRHTAQARPTSTSPPAA